MYDVEKDGEFYTEFLDCKAKSSRLMGGVYIYELWNKSGVSIHVTQLYTMYHPSKTNYPEDESVGYNVPEPDLIYYCEPEMPILRADRESIARFKTWVEALLVLEEKAESEHNLSLYEHLKSELEQADDYLKGFLSPQNKLIYEQNLNDRHRNVIWHSVDRFLKSIHEEHPLLEAYIKDHLVIGKVCYWKAPQ